MNSSCASGPRGVGYLLDEIRAGENAELRDEVTDLARKYGIVTPYTAYLIVEDEAAQRAAGDANAAATSSDSLARKDAAANWVAKRQKGVSGRAMV